MVTSSAPQNCGERVASTGTGAEGSTTVDTIALSSCGRGARRRIMACRVGLSRVVGEEADSLGGDAASSFCGCYESIVAQIGLKVNPSFCRTDAETGRDRTARRQRHRFSRWRLADIGGGVCLSALKSRNGSPPVLPALCL